MRLTAAVIPAVPAPNTATLVFRQPVGEYRGVAKVMEQAVNMSAMMILLRRRAILLPRLLRCGTPPGPEKEPEKRREGENGVEEVHLSQLVGMG